MKRIIGICKKFSQAKCQYDLLSTVRSPMQEALDELSQKWDIPTEISEIHFGKRDDLTEKIVKVGEVFFHMPFLAGPQLYVLWKCLWPDCHNCCEQPIRLPMTENDIELMRNKIGYKTKSDFIKNLRLSNFMSQFAKK